MSFFKFNKEIKTENLTLSDYDIKFAKKLVDGSKYKIEIVDYLRNKLGADTFIKGFKNHNFNIFVDKTDHLDMIQNKGENEKGLSS